MWRPCSASGRWKACWRRWRTASRQLYPYLRGGSRTRGRIRKRSWSRPRSSAGKKGSGVYGQAAARCSTSSRPSGAGRISSPWPGISSQSCLCWGRIWRSFPWRRCGCLRKTGGSWGFRLYADIAVYSPTEGRQTVRWKRWVWLSLSTMWGNISISVWKASAARRTGSRKFSSYMTSQRMTAWNA